MPAGDGTGPLGLGPRTGRAAGYCAGFPSPGFMNPLGGRLGLGLGRGRGMGRGFGFRAYGYRRFFNLPYSPYLPNYGAGYAYSAADELNYLKQSKRNLEAQLNDINQRIEKAEK